MRHHTVPYQEGLNSTDPLSWDHPVTFIINSTIETIIEFFPLPYPIKISSIVYISHNINHSRAAEYGREGVFNILV